MKQNAKLTITIFIFFLITLPSFSQQTEEINDFLINNFKHDKKEFYMKIYKNIKFPIQARKNCNIGKSYTRISISKDGLIENVQFLNLLGDGLEMEVERTVLLLKNDWKPIDSDSIRILDFTVAWKTDEEPSIKGDINVIMYGDINCESTEYYLNRLKKLMKKDLYEQAKYITEELVKRDAYSKKYRQLDKVVAQNLNKK